MESTLYTITERCWRVSGYVAICLGLIGTIAALTHFWDLYKESNHKNLPERHPGDWPLLGAWKFWSARWDFFIDGWNLLSVNESFRFHVGFRPVVALAGHGARATYHEDRRLNMAEGYAILFGKTPGVRNSDVIDTPLEKLSEKDILSSAPGYSKYFNNRALKMIHPDRLENPILPSVINDVVPAMKELQLQHQKPRDPFETVYLLIFKLTIRTMCCEEVAESRQLLEFVRDTNHILADSMTPRSIIAPPWTPLPERFKRFWGGVRFFFTMKKIIKERQARGDRYDDPLQLLLDHGDSPQMITRFFLTVLYSSELSTGLMVTYALCYLAVNEDWMSAVRKEVASVAGKYAGAESETIDERIADIPIAAWRKEFPILDACLRETIRKVMIGTTFRWNRSQDDVPIGQTGKVVPAGAFAVYHLKEVHDNAEIYTDPAKWDPGRFLAPRCEDKKYPHAFLGWGSGNHPCLGRRLANMISNVVLAFCVSHFEPRLFNNDGSSLHSVPSCNRNATCLTLPEQTFKMTLTPLLEKEQYS